MPYEKTIRGETFRFADLRAVFARATEDKSGEHLAGLAALSERERVAAKLVLADVPLAEIVDRPLIDPDEDDVSRLLLDTLDREAFRPLRSLTVGEFREYLLDDAVGEEEVRALQPGILPEVAERVRDSHRRRQMDRVGDNDTYFETGQGSALTAGAHHGVDQLTLEARAYGVAQAFRPFLVNSVVGFIGPEYLYDERQITRAGLEDHFLGKLLGLPMGCDVCYTNHAAADQNSADNLLLLLAAAGCNYFMGVPCADDVMLNYQSTSYHDALAVRRIFKLRPTPEFLSWLEEMGIYRDAQPASLDSARQQLLSGFD